MSIQEQMRRGTKSENDLFTGAAGETVYDTENNRQINHDGSKQGGYPIPNYLDVQSNYFNRGDAVQDGGGDYSLTLPYAPLAYIEGQRYTITPDANNAGACDININSLGLKNILKDDGSGSLIELEADDLRANIPVDVIYDGVRFILQLGGGAGNGFDLITQTTASASSTIDFTTGIDSTYDVYMITLANVDPSSDAALEFFFSINGGSSYIGSNYFYSQEVVKANAATGNFRSNSSGRMAIAGDLLNWGGASNESLSGHIMIYAPSGTTNYKKCTFSITGSDTAANTQCCVGTCGWYGTTAVNAFRLNMSAGNFASGEFALYGLKK